MTADTPLLRRRRGERPPAPLSPRPTDGRSEGRSDGQRHGRRHGRSEGRKQRRRHGRDAATRAPGTRQQEPTRVRPADTHTHTRYLAGDFDAAERVRDVVELAAVAADPEDCEASQPLDDAIGKEERVVEVVVLQTQHAQRPTARRDANRRFKRVCGGRLVSAGPTMFVGRSPQKTWLQVS